ncbi:MAG: MFS transporter [Candidatus Stahlbacteria bacterium]|nr:MFS transporter [Candidatus Stahlbacteria bacterium]
MRNACGNLKFFLAVETSSAFFTSLMAPFWVIYFRSVIGLSFEQISLLIIGNHAASMLLEIPTGAIADLWGRKTSVSISLAIGAFASIGIYFSGHFLLLLVFFILSGIGATFKSGAFEAWLADSLMASDSNVDLTKIWGKLSSFGYLASMLGFLIGSSLVHFGFLREIWLVEGAGIFLIFILVMVRGREIHKQSSSNKVTFSEYWQKVKNGSCYLFKRKFLIFAVGGSFFFYFSSGIISLLWQPYFKDLGIPIDWFGPILAAIMAQGIFIPRYSHLITKKLKGNLNTLGMVSVGCAVSLFLMRELHNFTLIFYFIYMGIYCLESPVFMGFINRFLPSEERATILSTYSLIISISTIICTYLFGFFSTQYGFSAALSLSILSVIVSAAFLMVSKKQEKKEEQD